MLALWQERFRVRRRRTRVKHWFARLAAALVVLVALAGCASAKSAGSGPQYMPSTSAISSLPPTAPVASTGATCGSVGTNDFSAATVLYSADPDALPCLAQAMTTCRPASLDIWQTAVDSSDDYRLTITGSATNGCKARLVETAFSLVPAPDRGTITAECTARMHDTDVLIACLDRTYLLPSS